MKSLKRQINLVIKANNKLIAAETALAADCTHDWNGSRDLKESRDAAEDALEAATLKVTLGLEAGGLIDSGDCGVADDETEVVVKYLSSLGFNPTICELFSDGSWC